jgi:hypothetical protein
MNGDVEIEKLKAIARSQGGDCLSRTYQGVDTKLAWQCARGHIWQSRPSKIKKGQWCPFCIGKHKTLADMKAFARAKGGDCLSDTYVNSTTPLIWQCERGHEWKARPSNVLFGTWCPTCCGQRQSIADLVALANERGGECLSPVYRGAAKKHLWRCKDDHTWQATPNSLKNGSWCPECHVNYGEEICRLYFQAIFGMPFPKCRPEFLRTGYRGKMELDGYCKDLRLAFEHHGVQHYRTVSHFHQNGKSLEKQRARDRIKLVLCAQARVRVVEIPSVPDITSVHDLPKCIARGLESLGIDPPIPPENVTVSLDDVYDRSCLDELRLIAESRGGELISSVYLGDRTKLRWRCAAGHEWDAVPGNVKSGAWCALCYGNVTKSIDEVRNVVVKKGITLLSAEYHGNKAKLRWACAKGHEWMATPQRVMHSTGCPRCAGQDKSIDDMRLLAQQNSGLCMSTAYRNMNAPLDWQCSHGHRFTATPNTVLRHKQQWCPVCRLSQRQQERITSRWGSHLLFANNTQEKIF